MVNRCVLLDSEIIIGIGASNTISMSNTMKITANIKNRVENGVRAEFIGSNPHSNGEIFSRSVVDRRWIEFAMNIKISGIKIAMDEEIVNIFIG